MSLLRVLFGAILGITVIVILWYGAIVLPPEFVSRRVAVWAAAFPEDTADAEIERLPCEPLPKIRFYVVCVDDCRAIWRVVAVKGLQPRTLADLARIPREPSGMSRRRFNTIVGREALRLDEDEARQMIGCFMRLEGMHPELILPVGGRRAVDAARGSERAMRRLTEDLDNPDALFRFQVNRTAEGFETRFNYWETSLAGRPVIEILFRLARDGQVRSVSRRDAPPATGGDRRTPGRPPTQGR